jgi:signal transduction histidine kinase
MPASSHEAVTPSPNIFNRILIWVVAIGVVSVILSILAVNISDRMIIDEAAGRYRHDEFLRAAGAVSRVISDVGRLDSEPAVQKIIEDILEVRPNLRWIDVFDVSTPRPSLIYTSRNQMSPVTESEAQELLEGRTVSYLDESAAERAWIILAPLKLHHSIVGGIRGRFSISKYDELILNQGRFALGIGIIAIVGITIAFLMVMRMQVHKPLGHLIIGLDLIRAGNLEARVPAAGPQELQQLALRFNNMLDTVAGVLRDKEVLLGELHALNATLEYRVKEAVAGLELANRDLQVAQEELKKHERLATLGELSAIMAHELGNPLNAISGRLQMIAATRDPSAVSRHFTIVKREVDRMVQVIQHILSSTRLDATPGEHDLNGIIREIIGLQLWKRTVVQLDLQDALPPVCGNSVVIRGIVLNLCTNAVQAMPSGGKLTLSTQFPGVDKPARHVVVEGIRSTTADYVTLTIVDQGRGIPPQLLSRICEPFFTTRHEEGGVGLGLAICRRGLVEMGGRLSVESVVGKGTRFIVDFPSLKEHCIS